MTELIGMLNYDLLRRRVREAIEAAQVLVDIKSLLQSRLPGELTDSGNLKIAVVEDDVGLAREDTLAKLVNALQSVGSDKLLVVPDNPPNLDIALSQLDSDLKARLPREIVLDDGTGSYAPVYRSGNALLISIGEDKVGLAKDSTVAGLKGSDGRTLTDIYNAIVGDQPRHITNAYDPTNDWFKISLVNDAVGLAKDSTVSGLKGPDNRTLTDIYNAITGEQPRRVTNAYDSANDRFKVSVESTVNPPNLDISLSSLRDSLKPDRGSVTQDLSGASIGAGAVQEVVKSNMSGWSALVVTVKATYDANATAGVRVRWLYSPDGTNYDSPEDAENQGNYYDLSFAAGATRQATILVPLLAPNVKIQVVNLDSSYPVTVDMWSWPLR